MAAVQSRAHEIGDGGNTHLDTSEELILYGTQTGKVMGGEIGQGSRGWDGLVKWYSWIPPVFEGFTKLPDPADFDPMIEYFDSVTRVFGGNPLNPTNKNPDAVYAIDKAVWTNIGGVSESIGNWRGMAAKSFDEFSDPFQVIPHNHCTLAHALAQSTRVVKQTYQNARNDAIAIADTTTAVLQGRTAEGCPNAAFVLTVVAAVAAFAAAVPTFGGSIPLFFAGVSSTAVVGAAVAAGNDEGGGKDENRITATIGGKTTDGVLDSMMDAVKRLEQLTAETEDRIAGKLQGNLDKVTNPRKRRDIVAPRPRLADLDPGNVKTEMGPPSGRSN